MKKKDSHVNVNIKKVCLRIRKTICIVSFLTLLLFIAYPSPVYSANGNINSTEYRGKYTTKNIDAMIDAFNWQPGMYWTTKVNTPQTFYGTKEPGKTHNSTDKNIYTRDYYGCVWKADKVTTENYNDTNKYSIECAGFAKCIAYLLTGSINCVADRGKWNQYKEGNVLQKAGNTLKVGDYVQTSGHHAIVYSVNGDKVQFIQAAGGTYNKIIVGNFASNKHRHGSISEFMNCGCIKYIYRAKDNSSVDSATLPEVPSMPDGTAPISLSNGSSFGLHGTISCKYKMTEIQGIVYNCTTQTKIYDISVNPNSYIYTLGSVGEKINNELKFGDSRLNNSWCRYSLKVTYDKNGISCQKFMFNRYFKVGNAASITLEKPGYFEFICDEEIRSGPAEANPLVRKCSKGTVVYATGYELNASNNMWLKLSDGNYVFSGDVRRIEGRQVEEIYVGTPEDLGNNIQYYGHDGDNKNLILQAYTMPIDAINTGISWTISNPNVLILDSSEKVDNNLTIGHFRIVGIGQTNVTAATLDGRIVSEKISIGYNISNLTMPISTVSLTVGTTWQANPLIEPSIAKNTDLNWISSNSQVATVDGNGKVTAVAPGTATIKATTADDEKTATCIVTVPAAKEKSLAERIRIAILNKEYAPELDLNNDGKVNAQDYILAKKETPQSGIEQYVYRCYDIILGREPDANGLNTWVNELNSGRKAAAEIIDNFVRSQEFLGKKHSNADAVEILYKAMLGRGSDPAGKADWVGKLDAGHPFAVVINGFCGSKEFKEICDTYKIAPGSVSMEQGSESDQQIRAFVTRCYKIILGRDPDGGGMSTWFDELKSLRRTAAEIIEQFVYSNEFQNRKYENPDAVEILYKAMLGRGSDPAGKADWVGRLNKGQPLTAIINGFCGSTEFTTICKTYGIKPGSVKVENVSRAAEEPAEAVVRKSETKANLVEITNPSDTVNEQLGSAVQAIYINEEKAKEFVGRCYRCILGREAGEEELGGWIKQMINGSKTADQIARGFLFSGEFRDKNVSNEELVKILYRVYMNREADAEGLATWKQKLDEGTSLNDLLNTFSKTSEFKAVIMNMAQ